MNFTVKTDKERIVLTPNQLIEHLSGRIFAKQREDVPVLSIEVIRQLGNRLGRITPQDLIALSMQFGYYYRVFLEKNEVEINHEEDPDSSTDIPSDEGSNS